MTSASDRVCRKRLHEHRAEHVSQWAAIVSIVAKIGFTAQTLSNWIRQAERDGGKRPAASADERERMKVLERENHQAMSILEHIALTRGDIESDVTGPARPGLTVGPAYRGKAAYYAPATLRLRC